MNQPGAALANIGTLASALEPALDESGKKALAQKLQDAKSVVKSTVDQMWCTKLGLPISSAAGPQLFEDLEEIMQKSNADYTIIFRQLACLPEAHGASPDS